MSASQERRQAEPDVDTPAATVASPGRHTAESDASDKQYLDCNICLEQARDPVVTLCGHVYCWPCLYEWLKVSQFNGSCPVCKAGVDPAKVGGSSRDDRTGVIPLYVRGSTREDPRKQSALPSRPQAQRPPFRPTVSFDAPTFRTHVIPLPAGATSSSLGVIQSLLGQAHAWHGSDPMGPRHGQGLSARQRQQQAWLSRALLATTTMVVICVLLL
eukprot:scaffold1161_cov391-Prasinococcus_capsulatus_cf.AAC.6